jgi:hypothetical protein
LIRHQVERLGPSLGEYRGIAKVIDSSSNSVHGAAHIPSCLRGFEGVKTSAVQYKSTGIGIFLAICWLASRGGVSGWLECSVRHTYTQRRYRAFMVGFSVFCIASGAWPGVAAAAALVKLEAATLK